MEIVAIYNLKGGVGKTSTAVNLAALAAQDGKKTAIWDLDPQGASTFYLGGSPITKKLARRLVDGSRGLADFVVDSQIENLSLIPYNFSMRQLDKFLYDSSGSRSRLAKIVKPLANEYDFLFIDCPPGIGIVAENIFRTATALLIPTIPTPLSMNTWFQISGFLADERKQPELMMPFFSMADFRKRIHKEIIESNSGDKVFSKAVIPYSVDVERMGVEQIPTVISAPKSRSSAAFHKLWEETQSRLKKLRKNK